MSHRQAVRGIIINGQSLLVIKRNKFGMVYYTLPGGGIELGEEPEQTLRREMQEEAGLAVGAVRPVFVEDAGDMYGMQYIYLCEYQGGEPRISPGTIEAELNAKGQNTYEAMWLPVDQLLQVPFRSTSVRDAVLQGVRSGFPETPIELAWQAETMTK
ncbi:MAG TPA: NUDIX domain-containing protein [Candidatus Saccharimonadales bacterium]|nr:NUDIX domain-containing protein [Candidatus Saccharimonadales bacterium]